MDGGRKAAFAAAASKTESTCQAEVFMTVVLAAGRRSIHIQDSGGHAVDK